jgi:cyclomaltodextrinase / maltogenic alpha-amylase / neopullulanase
MARHSTLVAIAALIPPLLLGGDSSEMPVAFSTGGGDAWSFVKKIEARVSTRACDAVAFGSGRELQPVRVSGGLASANLALRPGTNTVTVRCLADGIPRGRAAEQHWLVRLLDQPKTTGAAALAASRERPGWIGDAIVYGIAPQFYGRKGLAGVTARLDELAALGVTVLWLSPLTDAAPDDFGYAVRDHFRLRSAFGREADLKELVTEAHRRQMRVIMDFVPNHVSVAHAYFADAERRGRYSPYFDFFERGQDGAVEHYFDWEHLPNLDYDNWEVQRFIIEAFARWVRDFDVDGFRVDVAWGPRERAPEFWPQWRAELKAIKPDLLLLAEAPALDPYYTHNGFDAAYDWTDSPGEWAWREAFDDEARTAARLRTAIAKSLSAGSSGFVFRFLNNNDTGARFVTRYGPERTRVAAAMLLTLPGIPGLYAGDEIGAAFDPYDEMPIPGDDRHGLRAWYQKLIALRREHAALRSPDLRFLDVAPSDRVLAYVRETDNARETLLVLLNYGAKPERVIIPPGTFRETPAQLHDLISDERIRLDRRTAAIDLPAYAVRILRTR